MDLAKYLAQMGACPESIKWARDNGLKVGPEAWDRCPNPDWLVWFAIKAGVPSWTISDALIAIRQEVARHCSQARWTDYREYLERFQLYGSYHQAAMCLHLARSLPSLGGLIRAHVPYHLLGIR